MTPSSHGSEISLNVIAKLLKSSCTAVHAIDSMNAASCVGAATAHACITCTAMRLIKVLIEQLCRIAAGSRRRPAMP